MATKNPLPKDTQNSAGLIAGNDDLVKYYRQMLLIRRFEERVGQLYGMGLIGGFLHLYVGQEAVVVGVENAITRQDPMITSYRCHGHMLARGEKIERVLSELAGKILGSSKGKGGSMHMFSPENGFYGGHGIVGAQVPIGTGIALSLKYRSLSNICFTFLGDGAANQGQVYESYNMAALWNLPIVYVIENNQYGMGTSTARATAQTEFFRHGEGLGIPGIKCDGMNVLAVRDSALEAASFVRAGNGPMIVEMNTYRYRGHSISDPAKYRPKEEVKEVREKRDPITQLEQVISEKGILKMENLKEIDQKIRSDVQNAAESAQQAEQPSPSELYTDVYAARASTDD
ncbi:MAG: pyruvate dehydrogenase (acetyl-transferring) E1 component subunit alpha [Rhodospirillaceae bacterium]|nr:pyruvate dehydrogenase (acetyl-transferring) E1 component subunit alpha [Rhodospirillaceae bacterium]|tara:strand:- start:892 stop:1923 length:1032 start_codon:yes stop_codon:yes gene_type:complete